MKFFTSSLAALPLLLLACSSNESTPNTPSQAGSGGTTGGSGGAAVTGGTGGSSGGTGGSAGAPPATGGSSGNGGSGGQGGSTGGGAGMSTGGGAGASGGTTGGGAGTGGSDAAGTGGLGVAGAGSGDAYVSDVMVTVHPQVRTLLNVTWTQVTAVERTWLEFSIEGESVLTSRPKPGTAGAHEDVVIGVPGSTDVTVRIVSEQGGVAYKTMDYTGTTGALPAGMPASTVMMYDAALASPERFMIGAVEDSTGGCTSEACYFDGTWWIFAMDRKGRIVWYYADPSTNAVSSFPKPARDGEYLYAEKRMFSGAGNTPAVIKMSLDRKYFETVEIPDLSDCVDMTEDGAILYETAETANTAELREVSKDGTDRAIWSCTEEYGQNFLCYSNTVNYDPETDSVMLSFPEEGTVAHVDRATGNLIASYGNVQGAYAFSPEPWEFQWNHGPILTPTGTMLISTHLPGFGRFATAQDNQHAFEEFEIDHDNQTLTRVWLYGDGENDGPEWAYSRSMAIKTSNGNVLANYGSGGVIREITPDKQTVFYVKFDAPMGNDYYNKLVGNTFLIDDLYALNGAPE